MSALTLAANSHHIEFPALDWSFPLSDVLFSFNLFGFQVTIKWYGFLIALGFLLAVIYGLRRAEHFGLNPDKLIDAVLVCTLVAFVCARLYYVCFSDDAASYFKDPIKILQIWKGGIGIYGGVIGAFLSGLLMCKLCKLNTLAAFDLTSLGFLIGQAVGRWGNFFNQEAFGGNTTLPWGMTGDIIQSGVNGSDYIKSLPVHPTFLYESLWCLLGFILLHILSKKHYKFPGQIFCGYLIWYGIGRFMIEGLRTDSLMIGQVRASQLVAALAVVGGAVLLYVLKRRAVALPKALADGELADLPDGTETAATETPNYIYIKNTPAKEEAAEPADEALTAKTAETDEAPTAEAAETDEAAPAAEEDTHGNDH